MCHDLFRLHVLEPGLFEVSPDLLRSRPIRTCDKGCFEPRMHFQAGVSPRGRNARVDRVSPGGDAEDAAGGDDAMEFLDAGSGIVGKVDDSARESVSDASGRDIFSLH